MATDDFIISFHLATPHQKPNWNSRPLQGNMDASRFMTRRESRKPCKKQPLDPQPQDNVDASRYMAWRDSGKPCKKRSLDPQPQDNPKCLIRAFHVGLDDVQPHRSAKRVQRNHRRQTRAALRKLVYR